MDNLFCAILRDLEHLEVRARAMIRPSPPLRGVQRSGFEIGFWVVTTDPEFWHLDAPLNVSDEMPGAQAGPALCVLGRFV